MTGVVIYGSNNLYTVAVEGRELLCRVKGKKVKELNGYYNALVPGDTVKLADDAEAQIIAVEERRNAYIRWNQKGRAPQTFAANIDYVLCVSTPDSPPFRPRFLDRTLAQADIAGIAPLIVVNKMDLDTGDIDMAERLEDFSRIGYQVFPVSALSGEGLDALRGQLKGKLGVLVGQSGVGKSSLLNALIPGAKLKTAALSRKYQRGVHTTTRACLLSEPGGDGLTALIDTPGIRRLALSGTSVMDLALHFPEFAPLVGTCTHGLSCSHLTEPGCRILEAVAAGVIHEDRYQSYVSLREELEQRRPSWQRDEDER